MNDKDKDKARDKIVEAINKDNGLGRYLRSNPYSNHDLFSFDGVLTKDVFSECLYHESEESRRIKNEIHEKMGGDSGLNTFFIVGYQGCGKTTFINSVISFYDRENELQFSDKIQVDCDDYGVNGEAKALQKIFTKRILKYMMTHIGTLENYISFYERNHVNISDCINFAYLYDTYSFFLDFVDARKSLNDPCHINEIAAHFASASIRDSLYILLLLSLANEFMKDPENIKTPVLLFVDNMDYIDDYQQLHDFIDAIKALTKDMSNIFPNLILSHRSGLSSNTRFTKKVLLIISMRETTFACLPSSHDRDLDGAIFSFQDITEMYGKSSVVDKRLEFIRNSSLLHHTRKDESTLISEIMRDDFTNRVLVPLYNNNYRRVIDAITRIIAEHPQDFDDYRRIMLSRHFYLRHGARGILFKYILDSFNSKSNDIDNCFRRIGVLDLQNRKNNNISIARIILTYLSSHTETHCNNANNSVTLDKIVRELEDVFPRHEIIGSILNMYSLKDSCWSHLVSFCHLNANPAQMSAMLKTSNYDELNLKETMLHYSCAGKTYLEYMTSHYEFFTSRIFFADVPALFCTSNFSGSKRYVKIINKVTDEVEKCCDSLRTHNESIKTRFGLSGKQYEDSFFVAQIKRSQDDGRRTNQFHEDRLINSHIGYLDRFRQYLMQSTVITHDEKIETNAYLCSVIKRYVALLDQTAAINDNTRKDLLPYYQQQIQVIERTVYKDINTQIKRDL